MNGPRKIRNRGLLSAECFQKGKWSGIIGHLQWEPSQKSQSQMTTDREGKGDECCDKDCQALRVSQIYRGGTKGRTEAEKQ